MAGSRYKTSSQGEGSVNVPGYPPLLPWARYPVEHGLTTGWHRVRSADKPKVLRQFTTLVEWL